MDDEDLGTIEFDRAWVELERDLEALQVSLRSDHSRGLAAMTALDRAWVEMERDLEALDHSLQLDIPAPDSPITLDQALTMPEVGGVPWKNRPPEVSKSFTKSTLQNAIRQGLLGRYRPNTKNIFISRNMIKEMLITCQENENQQGSLKKRSETATAVLRRRPGSSGILTRELENQSNAALDAARTKLERLKQKKS